MTAYQIAAISFGPVAALAIAFLLYWLYGPHNAT
jgi:hypothetical protein